MAKYSPTTVEGKWQAKWKEKDFFKVDIKKAKEKYYNLVMFPYPSGDKLHIGHWYNFAPADSWGRYMKIKGKDVMQPMGFDSFGLPAENYAIKSGVHPTESIDTNVKQMIKQLSAMGAMWDWDKMVVTSTPEYYKWTQWIFLQLYKAGLAYKKNAPVNWCPSCQTVLANEQVDDGKCDRCKSEVEPKNLNQWFFKIRDYAEKLLSYEGLDWPDKTIAMQENWIGKSEGLLFTAPVKDSNLTLQTFSAHFEAFRADTFVAIAPDHPFLKDLLDGVENKEEILKFCDEILRKRIERGNDEEKESEGIFTGRYIVDPVGNGDLPIWIASFALAHYGTGIVKCSAHDERDFAFAKKYNIPLKTVLYPEDPLEKKKVENLEYCFFDMKNGILSEPKEFEGKIAGESRDAIITYTKKHKLAEKETSYRLRDWLISRQRYWGAPIPIVYCEKCGEVPLNEDQLPALLPQDVDFNPSGDGKSPLDKHEGFKNTKCPKCGGKAEREVDTMDTFVCSSWYYLRYPSSKLTDKPFDKADVDKWLPVDMYIGGPEHACMHLLYARFINMALFDLGHIGFKEPFKKLVHQGMITKDGAKMSKSKGNVVSPDSFVEKYGSDVFRMYLMFMGPFTGGGDWNDKGITGIARFVDRFYSLVFELGNDVKDEELLKKSLHKTIKKIGLDIEGFQFNTAVAALMEFVNLAYKNGCDKDSKKILVRLISPLAPHLAEECWEKLGEKFSVMDSGWPIYDESLVADNTITIGVQVNGKLRGEVTVSVDAEKDEVLAEARALDKIQKYLEEGNIVKEIYVPGKIVGFVVK